MNSNDILLEKVKEYCPICDEEHELDKRKRKSKLEIKDLIIEYDEIYFRCTKTQNEENEFVTSEMMDNNLLNAKDEYRRQKHLLTSQQIKDIRKSNGGKPLLHASVSAKFTMRSDRAQNSRTEALNLIRNRKGHLPHIVVVTAEPMPNRLASLALGTGDIDCVYHFALYELIRAVAEEGSEDGIETLETLVQGKRLKDISDLPLDLAV